MGGDRSNSGSSDFGKQRDRRIGRLNSKIKDLLRQFQRVRDRPCYPILFGKPAIVPELVEEVYGDLETLVAHQPCERLDVILDSSGGDVHAAYNLALLFRRIAPVELTFVIPRWAKSAATLLATAGDVIMMSPIAELGPIDPQITQFDFLERRFEEYSPLHIESTLELIREEYQNGNPQLAAALVQRLQFPMTLGRAKKWLEISENYLERLLSERMLKNHPDRAHHVAQRLVRGYVDHGFAITLEEARSVGLQVEELSGEAWKVLWQLYRLERQRQRLSGEAAVGYRYSDSGSESAADGQGKPTETQPLPLAEGVDGG